ncbi:MAG: helix-turn-helix domain-containing protein [Duncaniella sp.]|nr:helix-turn-helix domain-containing protein [Duncaniella sp.]
MTTIPDRLRHIMQLKRMTQRQMAQLLRIDPSNLSKVMNGKLPFTEGLINRIVVDLGISKSWLRDGVGVPYEKQSSARDIILPEPIKAVAVPQGTPVYDIDVTAGCRSLSSLFGEINPVGTIDIPGISAGAHIVKVRGDSMSPRISNGGYVAIRPIRDLRNIFWGQIYVVELEEFRLVKYLRRHSDVSMVILHSDNPEYDDMEVLRSDIKALYLVEAIVNCEVS